jgi:diguanylate cyclase (GGDEF)-like protein/PAS domain S-box-containing protein
MASSSARADVAAQMSLGAQSRERVSLLAATFAIAVGALVLAGWQFDLERLKRIIPGLVAMNPTTAICIVLSGLAVASNYCGRRPVTFTLGATIALIGAAKLCDVIIDGVPVDRLLFTKRLAAEAGFPNRMAPNTAAAIMMIGLAHIFAASSRRGLQLLSQALSVFVQLIAMFALAGYALSIQSLSGLTSFIPMALHTAIALFALATAIINQSRDVGLVPIIHDRGPAGSMIRTALPAAVSIPIAVGAAALWGQAQGFYGNEAAVALQVVANVVGTSSLLIFSIVILYRKDGLRRDREAALQESELLNRMINETRPDCVSLLDERGQVTYCNDQAMRAFGLAADGELLGQIAGDEVMCVEGGIWSDAIASARDGLVGRFTHTASGDDGEMKWFDTQISRISDAPGQPMQFIVMSSDVTQRRRVEEQARWSANHDILTRLPNRSLFQARLEETVTAQHRSPFALLLLDIDDFKRVNETLGHEAGDALLSTVSVRLRAAVGPDDIVARLGGDEFAIILRGVDTVAGANAAADKILERLRRQWAHRGRIDDCKVRIGIRVAVAAGEAPSAILKDAHIALSAAKSGERGRVVVFQSEMREVAEKRAMQLVDARQAISDDLIVPFYQPKVELCSGRVMGFEALLRWMDPTRGVRFPVCIEAAFENDELAQAITERMLTHALRHMRRWLDEGVDFGHVAINATAADFKLGDFTERLLQRLEASSIPRKCLQIEVTETVFLGRGAEYVERTLGQLSKSGIRIALDDFGTGYASLTHLKQLPVDVVKIDRTFLSDILHDRGQNAAIIRAVVNLGRSLGLQVVAEGVETADQQAYLIAQGCTVGQGFLYGKATPASHVPRLLRSLNQASLAA